MRRAAQTARWRGSRWSLLLLLIVSLTVPKTLFGQENAPTTDPVPESDQPPTEFKEDHARRQAYEAENERLRQQNEQNQTSRATLADALAEANAEAEVFRRQCHQLQLRMEALGLANVGEGRDPLEQRLLKSVRDLELMRRQKDALGEQLLALSESVLRYLKTASGEGDPQTRLNIEAELRATREALGNPVRAVSEAGAVPASLRAGLVLGYKEDLSLIVANFGRRQGVKVGMPLTVARGDAYVGRARVVQVRERIAGAVIEETASKVGKIKVGDQLRVEAFY